MVLRTYHSADAITEAILKCSPHLLAGIKEEPVAGIISRLEKNCTLYASPKELFSRLEGSAMAGARCLGIMNSNHLPASLLELMSIAANHLPLVIVAANRSAFVPNSHLCDHQAALSVSSCGWIMLFCATVQEFVDTLPQAFKISASTRIPVMVFIDGFYHTHLVTQLDVPKKEVYEKYLADAKIRTELEFKSRKFNFGTILPREYQKLMALMENALIASKEKIIQAEYQWNDLVDRSYGNGLYESYMLADAQAALVCMGSFYGNAHEAVDRQRKQGIRSGLLRLKCYRPFPYEVGEELENKNIGVFEKSIALGSSGSLYLDLLETAQTRPGMRLVGQFFGGLGGTDVNVKNARLMLEKIESGQRIREFIEGGN
ncbi:MAG: hypothetical protein WC506_04935 [Candidatus Micrarchaeia archaeon]